MRSLSLYFLEGLPYQLTLYYSDSLVTGVRTQRRTDINLRLVSTVHEYCTCEYCPLLAVGHLIHNLEEQESEWGRLVFLFIKKLVGSNISIHRHFTKSLPISIIIFL